MDLCVKHIILGPTSSAVGHGWITPVSINSTLIWERPHWQHSSPPAINWEQKRCLAGKTQGLDVEMLGLGRAGVCLIVTH